MEKLLKAFGNSSIMIICGTILAVNELTTMGIVLLSAGGLGSVFNYAVEIQNQKEEKEEREKIYDSIKNTIATAGLSVPFLGNNSDQVH